MGPITELDLGALIGRIRAGERVSFAELSYVFSSGVRFFLSRQLHPLDLEWGIQGVLSIVFEAINTEPFPEPQYLARFVLKVLKGQQRQFHDRIGKKDSAGVRIQGPLKGEATAIDSGFLKRRTKAFAAALREMPESERDVLRRYYVERETPEAIQRTLRLRKSDFNATLKKARSRFTS